MRAYLPQEYLDKLSPTYQRRLNTLENEFSETLCFKERQKLLDSFSDEYVMPRQLWDEMICLYFFNTRDGYDQATKDVLENLRKKALFQFYYDRYGKFRDHIRLNLSFQIEHRKLLKLETNFEEYHVHGLPYLKIKERQLTYPHQALEDVLQFYERYSLSSPSTSLMKTFCEMKKLYSEIAAVDAEDVGLWLEKLKKGGDNDFVIHNIEYRLGGDLCNVKLWELYIEYLRQINPIEMLHAYSKYCRFFFDDEKMLEKYKEESKEYGPIHVSWKNRFDFESPELSITNNLMHDLFDEGYQRTERIQWTPKQPCKLFFKHGSFPSQSFSIPSTVIHHILHSSNHAVLQKLYKSCKYFFAKKRMPICYKFDYTCSPRMQRVEFREQSMDVRMDQNGIFKFSNLFIANSLSFFYLPEIKYQTLSTIIQSFRQCEPKHLVIENQNLTLKEYEFLVEHGGTETMHFKNVKIADGNGETVMLEEIVGKLLKIYELCLDNVRCTSQTSQILCQLPFKKKIKKITLHHINDKLELHDFFSFLSENIHESAVCTFSCIEEANERFVTEFKNQCLNFDNGNSQMFVFSAGEYEMHVLN